MFHYTMLALQGYLEAIGAAALNIRNDAAPTVEELKTRMSDIQTELEAIVAACDGENRGRTDDEDTDMDRLFAEYETVKKDLGIRERIAGNAAEMSVSLGRQSEPEPLPGDATADAKPQAAARPERVPARVRDQREEGRWGWQSMGAFARGVQGAARNAGSVDPRLMQNAPTTFGTEGVGEDGGFAVPPEFRTAIMEMVMSEESLISRTDQLVSSSNTITIPTDETTPWQTSGGIQAFWENEGGQLSQSKPALDQVAVRLNKLTSLVPVTSELLEDAPALDTYLRKKAPEKMNFKISAAIFDGSGAGQPKGFLQSAATIAVAKEGGQSADTILSANITKMYSRMYGPCRSRAVWLINQDIEPQLFTLNHAGDSSPLFMPPGGLSASPFGTIMGRPVITTEAAKTLGDLGDIAFVDLSQYLTATKTGGVRAETSIHLWFDYDQTAFRFIMRVAGMPWWNSTIARFQGANTLSCFVTLAERS